MLFIHRPTNYLRAYSSAISLCVVVLVFVVNGPNSDKLSIKRLRSLEHQLVSAKHGMRAYQSFLTQANISQQDRETAEARIRELQSLVDSEVWSVGGKKMDFSEREGKLAACDALIVEAIKIAEQGDSAAPEQKQELFTTSSKKMESSSKLYRGSYRADFLMGMYSVTATRDFDGARNRFEECVLRARNLYPVAGPIGETNFIRALNNLALAKVREDKLQDAHVIWTEAVALRPAPATEIAHNIVRTWRYMQAAKGGPVLKVTDGTLDKFEALASAVQPSTGRPQADRGWIYMGYLSPADVQQGNASSLVGEKILVGAGTGIIVHPGYILCPRNIVADGNTKVHALSVQLGTQTSVAARIVAVDTRWDLALIHDPSIGGSPIPLSADTANNEKLEATLVTFCCRTPSEAPKLISKDCACQTITISDTLQTLAVEVDTAGLTNGGLMVDEKGGPLGIMVGGARIDLPAAIDITPIQPAIEFIKKNIPDYNEMPARTPVESSAFLTEFGQSMVHIESYCHAGSTTNIKPSVASLALIFSTATSDNACLMCDGRARVGCPARDCANGAVAQDQNFQVHDPLTGGTKNVPTRSNVRCGTCGGSGTVRCPVCSNGTDVFRMQ